MNKRKNCCCIEQSHFNYIADTVSSYFLLVVLFLISLSMLTGIIKNRGTLVLPFLALQTMDFILSFLMFFIPCSEIPSRQAVFIQDNITISKLDSQSSEWRFFQMCLRLMITCSCYVEFPTYLNRKPANYITYFSASMSSEKYIKKMIIFLVLHTAVILYKALMIWSVWKVFEGSNYSAKNEGKNKHLKEISKTALPSYKEAAKMKFKDLPPPYSTV
ncbi:lysosomal-associated transmembrane protein 5 [Rhinoderma darwinii]|uniref:lysosomal-associated transmembrane protein 5 n=1 Tax=Rhinoderma darwinii TaxID=43563 RepID=UPI003F666C1D